MSLLEYRRIAAVPEDRFRLSLGALSLFLSVLSAATTLAVFFVDYYAKSFPFGINGLLRLMLLLSAVGLMMGLAGLLAKHGRSMAVLGTVLCLLNLGFIPTFMVH